MGSSESTITKPEEVEQGGFHIFELHLPTAAYSSFFVIFLLLLIFFGVYFCLKKCNLCKRFFYSPPNAPHNPYKHQTGESHGRVMKPGGAYSISMAEASRLRDHKGGRDLPNLPPVRGVAPPSDHVYTPPGRRSSLLSLLESNAENIKTAAPK